MPPACWIAKPQAQQNGRHKNRSRDPQFDELCSGRGGHRNRPLAQRRPCPEDHRRDVPIREPARPGQPRIQMVLQEVETNSLVWPQRRSRCPGDKFLRNMSQRAVTCSRDMEARGPYPSVGNRAESDSTKAALSGSRTWRAETTSMSNTIRPGDRHGEWRRWQMDELVTPASDNSTNAQAPAHQAKWCCPTRRRRSKGTREKTAASL